VEETVAFLKKNKMATVGIISTSITIQNKLYEKAFLKAKIRYDAPNGLQQAKLGKIIHNLVTGQHSNKDREFLISIIDSFEKKSVDCVILACTDLQLLIPKHKNLKTYDTMKILADATVQRMLEK
jgi:aspartate racemase